jgi:tryptophanyl-tRNA synthetase
MEKIRMVSGIRPTGLLHLGHLEGMLKNAASMQDQYECYPFIADWHALTDVADTTHLPEYTLQAAIDWLSAGIDPEKSTLFVQSHVPEHAELATLLTMITPVAWLERCPTYKDKIQDLHQREGPSTGLLEYPVLMTADVIIYKAEIVPVGADQVAHLEISREIVRRFNNLFGEVFPEPKPALTETPALPGLDGRKMSKSYNNTIKLSDPPETTRQNLMKMVTDPGRVRRSDPGNPDVCPVFAYHKVYNLDEVPQIDKDCRSAAIGCVDCKRNLSNKLITQLTPFYERRAKWASNPKEVREVLADGANRAGKVAKETMAEVRTTMNLSQNQLVER